MVNNFQLLHFQKTLIEKQFRIFKCDIIQHGQKMVCKGWLQPLDYIEKYHVEIIQYPGKIPKVFIKTPRIIYNSEIHMYTEGNLCLFYPPDFKWGTNTSIAQFTIPWVNEWIIYYEIYKINGVWEGLAAPHKINNNK